MYITEVSKIMGLSTDTLRYYERVGLIPRIERSPAGLRLYGETDCCWIEFIKNMRSAGVPIDILVEYVRLYQQGESTFEKRKEILAGQMALLDAKISELQLVREKLRLKIAANYERIEAAGEETAPAAMGE
ncbi:MAG: MerR family transcriptional regulator [Synergistaceae bacterium]|nr:MerR family transcriptional regulator [Synergistaceae bacterium]